ncbi:MAG: ankyrin repeat domain-containing protein [Fidelibacterota bacterium]|nr:MAG: ankyrin repeat domain-containing protein [Candidatus Neomarinimicrobiota bacterium]
MKKQNTRFDRIISRIKNNPVAASVIVLGTIIIALATFTDATKNLLSMIKGDRPEEARAELAQLSLEYSPDVFVKAAEKGDVHAVKLFLTAGMDPDVKDEEGNTALLYAAMEGDIPIINALLKANANVNEESGWGETALDWAAARDDESMLRTFLENGAATEAINKALITAARRGHIEILRILLDNDATTEAINKAFITAAKEGHLESLRILLDSGAEVDKVGGEALLKAAISNTSGNDRELSEIVDFLLKQGADVNAKDEDGWVPLHYAALRGSAAVVRNLLDAGAEVNERCECLNDKRGWTPLLLALDNGYDEVAKTLLATGADVNAKQNRGRTALMYAVDRFDKGLIQALLDAGARVDEKDSEGYTALEYGGYRKDRDEIKQLLLDAKARAVKATKPR